MPTPLPWSELWRSFGRIGLLSFGGPAAQIAVMHRELVELRGWLSERQFLSALSFCMLLPGPEAMQLATYAGWRLRGVAGGLLAGLLFVLPGAAVMMVLAWAYHRWGAVPLVQAAFLGIKAAVVLIVVQALVRIARRALSGGEAWAIAALAFLAIHAFAVPFPAIVLAAALWGALRGTAMGGAAGHGPEPDAHAAPPAPPPAALAGTARTIAIWGAIWAAPILLALAAEADFLAEIGLFFSRLAVVSFGGAYAVLAYVAQEAVSAKEWLSGAAMLDGLGLAETTPGPLILVTQFVGYQAGAEAGGTAGGLAAASMTLWATFAPCFLWIFAGAPWIEVLTARPRLNAALRAITASVVGVILNLSLWFALRVFFGELRAVAAGPLALDVPVAATLDPVAVLLALLAALLLFALRLGLPLTLALCALAGLAAQGLA